MSACSSSDNETTIDLSANGGTASSQANGGSISVGDVNSGGNTGNQVQVGN